LNSDASQPGWPSLGQAERRVLDHQRKLHRWARSEPARRFADVFNLICDRATLLVAWERVSGDKGAMTVGVDAVTRHAVVRDDGLVLFLEGLRTDLRQGRFTPLPVRKTTIPKNGGKVRYLGIATLRERVAQIALKLILEPIFETDFYPSSYGYRPGRRAQDAVAEIHHVTASRRPTPPDPARFSLVGCGGCASLGASRSLGPGNTYPRWKPESRVLGRDQFEVRDGGHGQVELERDGAADRLSRAGRLFVEPVGGG
jgi:hypothetical protein